MAGPNAHDAAQLDRPQRRHAVFLRHRKLYGAHRRLYHAHRYAVRSNVSGDCARTSAPGSDRDQTAKGHGARIRGQLKVQIGTGAHQSDGKTRRLHRRACDQSALARARADLGDELCAGRVWYRRRDGSARARRTRLRFRAQARLAGRASRGSARRFAAGAHAGGLRRRGAPHCERRFHRHVERARAQSDDGSFGGAGPGGTSNTFPVERLAGVATTVLGDADSNRLLPAVW